MPPDAFLALDAAAADVGFDSTLLDLSPDGRTLAGVEGGNRLQSGSRAMSAARPSVTVRPAKGWRPVNISYSTQPNAHTSARRSTISPRACSGLM